MKKSSFLFFLPVALWSSSPPPASPPIQNVSICQIISHPALDRTVEGIVDGLAALGYSEGDHFHLRIESAQGNALLASQIAMKFVNEKADVVVAVGTVAAQSFLKYARSGKTRLIFSSITDPVGAGLVESLSHPGNHTSGVSNYVSLEEQLSLFQQMQPLLKRLGVIYNPGESNSVSLLEQLEPLCERRGLSLVIQAAHRTADVAQAAVKLCREVDALFISNDNTALAALETILRVAHRVGIPVYVSDTDVVPQGPLAALGPNQYDIGKQTAEMVAAVLKGDDPSIMAVAFPRKKELCVNRKTALLLNLSLSSLSEEKSSSLSGGTHGK